MKKVLSVLTMLCFSSCMDYLYSDEIPIGTWGLVLLQPGDTDGYFLGRSAGSSNYHSFVSDVTNVIGNDSILLVDSHSGYYKMILSKLDSAAPATLITRDEFLALKLRLSIKYNAGPTPKVQ